MAPSEPVDVVVAVIEQELGIPVDELFESIEETPCGAASTGQAHIARLKSTGLEFWYRCYPTNFRIKKL